MFVKNMIVPAIESGYAFRSYQDKLKYPKTVAIFQRKV